MNTDIEEKEGYRNNIDKRRRQGKRIRSEKRQGHSRFHCGSQTRDYSRAKQQIECLPGSYRRYRPMNKYIEEKEEKLRNIIETKGGGKGSG